MKAGSCPNISDVFVVKLGQRIYSRIFFKEADIFSRRFYYKRAKNDDKHFKRNPTSYLYLFAVLT